MFAYYNYILILGFIEVGGYQGVLDKYPKAISDFAKYYLENPHVDKQNTTYAKCGVPPDTAFHLFRPYNAPDLPWPGVVFGLTISAVWYLCADQVALKFKVIGRSFTF